MSRPPRRTWTPTPGTERCHLCRQIINDQHTNHPWTDVVVAAWVSSPVWKAFISGTALLILLCLAATISLIRAALTGDL